jgi:broad specificity phosphatase PhoE
MGIPYRSRSTLKEIIFVRHAESQANIDGVWNGRTDGPLSSYGEGSLEALGRRLSNWEFDLVISSPLERARKTAESFASDIEIDEDFIEIDLGRWEEMKLEEIRAKHGDELDEALTTRTMPMGGTGESLIETGRRALSAVDRLADSLGEDQKAVVVTHGGFLQAVLRRHMPGLDRRVHAFTSNTAITRVVWQFGGPRLASFNDTGHFGPRSHLVEASLAEGIPVLAFVRHGRTRANVEMRWQGQGDWDLDDLGRSQAVALGAWYGQSTTVYSSPLKRACSTAGYVALNGVVAVDDLKELSMGNWEGLTTIEISERWPKELESIFRDRVDLKRGETGESWGELTSRFVSAVGGLRPAADEPTVVVAHGGAIRAYMSSLTTTNDTHAESLFTPANTSVSHVAITERGPEILDYAVSTHLESLQ